MSIMRAVRSIVVLTAAGVGITTTPVEAQVTTWSVTGAGCVPTGQTAAGVGTFNSAGDSKFPGAAVGEIILTCPVPSSIAGAVSIGMTYRDSDGPGNGVRVRAVLRQKRLANGAVADVPGAALDSNSFPIATATIRNSRLIGTPCNGHGFSFDHNQFTYYVQVNMVKGRASLDVLLASVDLTNSLIC